MAYVENEKSTGLDVLTTLAAGDLHIVGDVSDSGRAKAITQTNLEITIANSTNFVDELVGNTYFTTTLANDSNFISELTSNASFITNLNNISPSPLTTKGDVYTFSSVAARLPVGTNGQVLSADSAETTGLKWIDLTNGGGGGGTKIEIETTSVQVTATTTETALATINIPGGTLGTNDAIRFNIVFNDTFSLDNSASLTFRLKYGGTTIASAIYQNQSVGTNTETPQVYGFVVANNATNAQKGGISFSAGTGENDSPADSVTLIHDYGTSAVDSTVDQNLVITAQFSSAGSPSNDITKEFIIVEEISEGSGIKTKEVSISSAEILDIHNTPIEIITAPGAGKVIVIDRVVYSLDAGTQYANGSSIEVVYDGDTTPLVKVIEAADVTSATDIVRVKRPVDSGGDNLNITAGINQPITLQQATPTAFITGTGTAKLVISYQIVTL